MSSKVVFSTLGPTKLSLDHPQRDFGTLIASDCLRTRSLAIFSLIEYSSHERNSVLCFSVRLSNRYPSGRKPGVAEETIRQRVDGNAAATSPVTSAQRASALRRPRMMIFGSEDVQRAIERTKESAAHPKKAVGGQI